MDSAEAGTDMSELREIQNNLSSRISRFEESVNLHHVNESLRRIIRLEESVGHGHVGESVREFHVRLSQWQCAANLARLEDRMRTQNWHHELSDQESDDEVDRMVGDRPSAVMQARVPLGLVA